MKIPSQFWLPFAGLLALSSAAGQDTEAQPAPGHSQHGESFSEGPRRRGALMEGMGSVSFPVTTASPEAQQWFNQGVGQLHGFWYWEAERSFRTVLRLDPDCLMAHWGLAMANLSNQDRARGFLEKVKPEAMEKLTARERAWIAAVRQFLEPPSGGDGARKAARKFLSDLEDLAAGWPDDLEAKAFVVGQQWAQRSHLGLDSAGNFGMDAIARAVLAKNPAHPVHHYLIHLWDGDKYARALEAAAQCGPAAPGIAHMWHMPSHIYSGLHRWADAAWQQEVAARVDHAQMIRTHTMPDQIHNFAHNSEWLVRNLNNLGRVREAVKISTDLIAMPRIPRSTKVGDQPDQKFRENRSAWEYGTNRLRDTLLMWEEWELALQLADTPWLADTGDFDDRWKRTQLLALASFRTGKTEQAMRYLTEFENHLASQRTGRAAAIDAAERRARDENKDSKAIGEAMTEAMKPFNRKLDTLEPALTELRILADLSEGRHGGARAKLQGLKGIHDQRQIALRVLLADFDKAAELAANYASRSDGQVQPQAILTDVLWRAGRHEEAIKAFGTLRSLAGHADPETPLLARLGAVAAAAEVAGDWRQPPAAADDVGPRPPVDSFGPLTWEGWMAPTWTATAPDGSAQGHATLAGRPYVALFVLGGSCTHCNEQLQVFGAKKEAFAAAGLPLVVVTTDAAGEIPKDGELPFWSGADGSAFKALDAWDDFEEQPLHTTVLVDASGRIRWQHSGYEPFMQADFLLEEAQRLFQFDAARPDVLASH